MSRLKQAIAANYDKKRTEADSEGAEEGLQTERKLGVMVMKRLVDYSSDEDRRGESSSAEPRPQKKRKLPSLSASLAPPRPSDNPALHQGRTRSTPYIEGQYAAYIYVPFVLDPRSRFTSVLREILISATERVPTLHPFVFNERELTTPPSASKTSEDNDLDETGKELHISLSRPIYLRAHQREDLKRAVKTIARAHRPFKASFATCSELVNDERTRTFLTLEVGAGHDQLKALCESLTPMLRALRQRSFYTEPRFHASVGWALLDRPQSIQSSTSTYPKTTSQPPASAHDSSKSNLHSQSPKPANPPTLSTPEPSNTEPTFETIPNLPADLIPSLVDTYSSRLSSSTTGSFEVDELRVKIGKDTFGWKLSA